MKGDWYRLGLIMGDETDKFHGIELKLKDVDAALNTNIAKIGGLEASIDEKHRRNREWQARVEKGIDDDNKIIETIINSANHAASILQVTVDCQDMISTMKEQNMRLSIVEDANKELRADKKALAKWLITSLIMALCSLVLVAVKYATK